MGRERAGNGDTDYSSNFLECIEFIGEGSRCCRNDYCNYNDDGGMTQTVISMNSEGTT